MYNYNRYVGLKFQDAEFEGFYGGSQEKKIIGIEYPPHITFDCSMTDDAQSNEATVTIYNMSPRSQSILREKMSVEIWAGYQPFILGSPITDGIGAVLKANIRDFITNRDGNNDYATIIKIGEGDDAYAHGRITSNQNTDSSGGIVDGCLKVLKDEYQIDTGFIEVPDITYSRPKTFNARSVRRVLDDLCYEADCRWFIQDGKVNLYPRDNPLIKDVKFVYTPDTGLIGSPRWEKDGVSFEAMMNPFIRCGDKIQLANPYVTQRYSLTYCVESIDFTGSNLDGSHQISVRCREIGQDGRVKRSLEQFSGMKT